MWAGGTCTAREAGAPLESLRERPGRAQGQGAWGWQPDRGLQGRTGGQVRENKPVLRPKDPLWKSCGVFGRGTPGLGASRDA